MITAPATLKDLTVHLRRQPDAHPLRPPSRMRERDSLVPLELLQPERIDQEVRAFAPVAAALGALVLPREQARRFSRSLYPQLGGVLLTWSLASGRLREGAIPGLPAPSVFLEARSRLNQHRSLARAATRGMTTLLDLRLLLGVVMWSMLQSVLIEVQRRLADRATPAVERRRLREAFAPLLVHKERILRPGSDREARSAAVTEKPSRERSSAAERLLAEQQTFVSDVMFAIRMGWPVEPDTLRRAAELNYQHKHPASPAEVAAVPMEGAEPTM